MEWDAMGWDATGWIEYQVMDGLIDMNEWLAGWVKWRW